jgi:ArsR family transcriptional regulator
MERPLKITHGDALEAQMKVLKALSHPLRLSLVHELSKHERTVADLSKRLDVKTSALSRHLSILQNAGLVSSLPRQNTPHYRLRLPSVKRFLRDIEASAEAEAQEEFLRILGYV